MASLPPTKKPKPAAPKPTQPLEPLGRPGAPSADPAQGRGFVGPGVTTGGATPLIENAMRQKAGSTPITPVDGGGGRPPAPTPDPIDNPLARPAGTPTMPPRAAPVQTLTGEPPAQGATNPAPSQPAPANPPPGGNEPAQTAPGVDGVGRGSEPEPAPTESASSGAPTSGLISSATTPTSTTTSTTSSTTTAGTGTNQAWTPATGLSSNIEEGERQEITGSKYTPVEMGEIERATVTGYNPEGYTAQQVTENLSQATARVLDAGSPLMRRAGASATAAANARGLQNSSMAVQAGQAAILDQALQIAAGDVDVSKFNVGQNNDALRFTADAKNAAAQFLANAQNQASQFNSAEANKRSMFAAEQANAALRFAAEAEQAAKAFNAEAFNSAKQKYADAVNAARAAEQDAQNMARRDAATFTQQTKLQELQNSATLGAANISARASMANAALGAQVDRERMSQNASQFEATQAARRYEFDTSTRLSVDQMGQNAFNNYQAGFNALQLNEMEPEARTNAINNYNALWAGNPYLPIRITPSGSTSSGTTSSGTAGRSGS